MQETSIQLFQEAYVVKPKIERWFMILAFCSVAVHVNLLYRLAALNDYRTSFLLVYFLNLIPLAYFLITIWLDKSPNYRRHLTLTNSGVRYRPKFMAKEQEFDWEEVDVVLLKKNCIKFVLKNEEEFDICLEKIHNDRVLELVKKQIKEIVLSKDIELK